jgi:hypothetical protein
VITRYDPGKERRDLHVLPVQSSDGVARNQPLLRHREPFGLGAGSQVEEMRCGAMAEMAHLGRPKTSTDAARPPRVVPVTLRLRRTRGDHRHPHQHGAVIVARRHSRPDPPCDLFPCPVGAGVGSEDPIQPPAQREAFAAEMQAAGVDWRIAVYGGALHAFHHPMTRTDHVLVAARRRCRQRRLSAGTSDPHDRQRLIRLAKAHCAAPRRTRDHRHRRRRRLPHRHRAELVRASRRHRMKCLGVRVAVPSQNLRPGRSLSSATSTSRSATAATNSGTYRLISVTALAALPGPRGAGCAGRD